MRKIISEKNISRIFHFIALLFFAVLFMVSLFISGYNRVDCADEYVILEKNSLLRIILLTGIFLSIMLIAGFLYDKIFYKWNRYLVIALICMIGFAVSIYWARNNGAAPIADQGMIVAYANALNDGDFNGIKEGRYIARCMQQLGLITVLRGGFALFGRGNYMAYEYWNAVLVPVFLFAGSQVTRKLSGGSGKAEFYFLVLAVTCFPLYGYVPFIYGDLGSTVFMTLAAWAFLSCLEKFSLGKLFALALTAGIAVQLRMNSLIILIAFGIVVIVKLIGKWDWKKIAMGGSVVCGIFLSFAILRGIYYNEWDENARSIPPILYVAMGLHETNGHPGWYDGYNYIVFAESGDDVKASAKIAWDDIRERLQNFKENPDYMLYFYKTKINEQWQAPMYQCLVMNSNIEGKQSRAVQMIYREELLGKLVKNYMKAFQVFLYGCIFLWLLLRWNKPLPIEKYLLLIAVFGGFLFSILWEAKTRYIFPYLLIMLPYFAMGMNDLNFFLLRNGKKFKK